MIVAMVFSLLEPGYLVYKTVYMWISDDSIFENVSTGDVDTLRSGLTFTAAIAFVCRLFLLVLSVIVQRNFGHGLREVFEGNSHMPVHHGVQHGAAVMNRANSDEENVLLNPEERNHPGYGQYH